PFPILAGSWRPSRGRGCYSSVRGRSIQLAKTTGPQVRVANLSPGNGGLGRRRACATALGSVLAGPRARPPPPFPLLRPLPHPGARPPVGRGAGGPPALRPALRPPAGARARPLPAAGRPLRRAHRQSPSPSPPPAA